MIIVVPKVFIMALFHCVVRLGSARLRAARLGSARFVFTLQFSTGLERPGLFTCRYSCAASSAVTPEKLAGSASRLSTIG